MKYMFSLPAGRSVLGTVPGVFGMVRGRRSGVVAKTLWTIFPHSDRPRVTKMFLSIFIKPILFKSGERVRLTVRTQKAILFAEFFNVNICFTL